uniref:Uncharacterized protein n=1 Tax=Astatotilapia calliptera TaxID=8154 RepID=A0AAX7SEM4_ASTCA
EAEDTEAGPGEAEDTEAGPGEAEDTEAGPGVDEDTEAGPGVDEDTEAGPGVDEDTEAGPGVDDGSGTAAKPDGSDAAGGDVEMCWLGPPGPSLATAGQLTQQTQPRNKQSYELAKQMERLSHSPQPAVPKSYSPAVWRRADGAIVASSRAKPPAGRAKPPAGRAKPPAGRAKPPAGWVGKR